MLVRIENREAPEKSSLIWVCTVCIGIFLQATSELQKFRKSTVTNFIFNHIDNIGIFFFLILFFLYNFRNSFVQIITLKIEVISI